jgi:5'-3' exonuclease
LSSSTTCHRRRQPSRGLSGRPIGVDQKSQQIRPPYRIVPGVIVHLVDGTYELFRYFLSPAAAFDRSAPEELRAVRGVVGSVLGMLEGGATHLGVATDHVIESFRNALWPGYKTGEGIDPLLYGQFHPLEDALRALGVVVWPMVEFEADDALGAAAAMAAADTGVDQVVVCTPDKDLAQCVRGDRIVQLDRRARELRNEWAVREKFGVPPTSIPDWLALVGDSADGYPGLPGWGARSAATVLARYQHLEHIPELAAEWDVSVRGALRLATTLTEQRERARLFRELATLRADTPIGVDVDALRWRGPRADFATWSERLGTPRLHERAVTLATARPTEATERQASAGSRSRNS